jgi:hypothetical protein
MVSRWLKLELGVDEERTEGAATAFIEKRPLRRLNILCCIL